MHPIDALSATPGNGQMRASYAAPPVELLDAIRICLKEKYATFSGRASRSEFWFFQLFLFLLATAGQVLLTIFFFLHFPASAADANDAAFTMVDSLFEGARFFILFGISALVMLALALPEMAVTALGLFCLHHVGMGRGAGDVSRNARNRHTGAFHIRPCAADGIFLGHYCAHPLLLPQGARTPQPV